MHYIYINRKEQLRKLRIIKKEKKVENGFIFELFYFIKYLYFGLPTVP